MKRLIQLSSLLSFFTSCYLNQNIYNKNKIYLKKIENFSNQPTLNFILEEKFKEAILKYPGYSITNYEDSADYIIELKILDLERIPLSYSKENPDEISSAKFQLKLKVNIREKDKPIFEKDLFETFSTSIYKNYREEEILNKVAEQMAKKIYFEILKLNKK
ncbi:MAG: hypothetical protein NC915_02750 [Candidatus Omnitrophica bacterium]|nr:hypothetical protein [Candidatus Omnitrophota bacterium]